MIEVYLNQTAGWKQKTGSNKYNEPQHADQVGIPVRWQGKRRMVKNEQGEEVVSEVKVFTKDPVSLGDRLIYNGREWPVVSVLEVRGLDGEIEYYEVAL